MQIIVLGAHRSGTSLVTRLINMMGAYFAIGETALGANEENPKGFWERWDVIAANDAVLKHHGCEWDKLANWKFADELAKKDVTALAGTTENIKKIILELDANRPWVVKDPRMCLTYPYWKPHLELPVIVCVYRNPLEIARSLKTRNEFSFSQSMALWEYYATGVANAIRDVPTLFVSHHDMITDPVGTVKKLFEELQAQEIQGLRLPTDREITSFIDPTLYRSRDKQEALDDMVTPYQKRLMDTLSGKEVAGKELHLPTELSSDLIAALDLYRAMQQRLEEQNQIHATTEQYQHEMERRVESAQREIEALKEKCVQLAAKEREDIELLKQSSSWRIGNRIVRFMRAITFKSESAA
jgi:Sulfotransferase family